MPSSSSSCLLFWLHLFLFLDFTLTSLSNPFLPSNNVTLYGDAHRRNSAISLTQERTCSGPSSSSSSLGVGRALYPSQIRFLDADNEATASFSCEFSFSIIQSPLCPFGDGIAFLITSNANSFSLSNGYMGLPGPAFNPKDSFIAVEFDTSSDPSLGDVSDNHIGIDVNTVKSFASVDAASKGIDLKSGRPITAWIEYTDEAKIIQVWASYSQVMPPSPVLVAEIDLSSHFKDYMYVGFSASNGQGSSLHLVDHWRFRTYGSFPSVTSNGSSVGGGDCFICYEEHSKNNIDPPNKGHPHRHRRSRIGEIGLGLIGLAAFIVSIIAALVLAFLILRKKKQEVVDAVVKGKGGQIISRVPGRLSIAEVKAATMGFHGSRIIGQGASATVYKGSLPSGVAVAVKRFNQGGIEYVRNPFITEFATMVGCVRHENLVELQGWCCEGTELVLVYEYMPNGSLDKVLHSAKPSAIVLSWKQRLNIVHGVASALSYLHQECERQIIHRDVKSCNILLDEEFNAKLGDFGLAEVYEHRCLARAATIPAGTMGYLAPEYVYYGVPSVKTDVYSFGVVILEIASGRRPVAEDGTWMVDWVWGFWERGKLFEAIDPRLRGKSNPLEVERMFMVGLACVHPNNEKRPTIEEIGSILEGEAPLPILPARRPILGFQPALPEDFDGTNMLSSWTEDASWMTPKSHFG
ncbi:hypothetical protein Tsubulata_022358 [Turnera subulata]|uniref:non-specific serine/threonine protein kinase n=1 Tax=Turnera subulata TaxID=218843 RepID=A0A9Q0FRZ6_9ROSI|nr:hypothetical protein Tsubulata_022358 [Turnera subulata]